MQEQGVAAVDRALTVLAALAEAGGAVSLAELARRTGLYKSTILRLCASLEKAGYLGRLEDGRFRLGPQCLNLGAAYRRSFDLGAYVMPILTRLRDLTGESASFYVREGNSRICLYRVESFHIVRNMVSVGDMVPLDRGAAGRLILAFDTEGNEAGAGPSGDDAMARRIREDGFAVSHGERDSETAAVAAPVFDLDRRLAGALSVSGPRHRFAEEAVARFVSACRNLADDLSRQLGGWRNPQLARLSPTHTRTSRA